MICSAMQTEARTTKVERDLHPFKPQVLDALAGSLVRIFRARGTRSCLALGPVNQ